MVNKAIQQFLVLLFHSSHIFFVWFFGILVVFFLLSCLAKCNILVTLSSKVTKKQKRKMGRMKQRSFLNWKVDWFSLTYLWGNDDLHWHFFGKTLFCATENCIEPSDKNNVGLFKSRNSYRFLHSNIRIPLKSSDCFRVKTTKFFWLWIIR